MDIVIFLNSLRGIQNFIFWDDIPNASGKYRKSCIYLRLEFYFWFRNGCDAEKSTLYVLGTPCCVHSCASDVTSWMAKHYCQVRAGQRHKSKPVIKAVIETGTPGLWVILMVWSQPQHIHFFNLWNLVNNFTWESGIWYINIIKLNISLIEVKPKYFHEYWFL